ncbi:MAG: hypothetical protein WD425_21935 [Nitrospirales bacterium]
MTPYLFRIVSFCIYLTLLSSCTHQNPLLSNEFPPPSKESFSDQVLEGLAAQKSEEIIHQLKADRTRIYKEQVHQLHEARGKDQNLSNLLMLGATVATGPLATILGPLRLVTKPDPKTGVIEEKTLQTKHDHDQAVLDTKQIPLKHDILELYMNRTKRIQNGFSVCVDGKERRYAVLERDFVRTEDGQGPCPKTSITNLKTFKEPPPN